MYHVYTYFEIPDYALSTYKERCRWCSDRTTEVLKCFRTMMQSYSYLARKNHAKMIIEGTAGGTYTWHDIPAVHSNAKIETKRTPVLYANTEEPASPSENEE